MKKTMKATSLAIYKALLAYNKWELRCIQRRRQELTDIAHKLDAIEFALATLQH